jgi:hypothetical protein
MTVQTKLQQQQIENVTAKAKKILSYLKVSDFIIALLLGTFTFVVAMDKN